MKKIITTLKESEPNTPEPQISSIIEKEYHEKYQASGTHKKTWYSMMLKYHPDKFKENKEKQMKDLNKFLNNWKSNKNLILITHYVVISEVLNYASSSGEIVVSDKNLNIIGNIKFNY